MLFHIVFCCWDFSVKHEVKANLYSGQISQQFLLLLEEARTNGAKISRSRNSTILLYCKRIVLFIIYLAVQASASAGLFLVTAYSNDIKSTIQNKTGYNGTQLAYFPAVLYSIINMCMPLFLW